jgi:Na+/H+ antiporter NhaD/arsenite permease-like protein
MPARPKHAFRQTLLEFSELMLFLLVAMTYINALEERRVFDACAAGWSARASATALFWITGVLAFVISPIADNLTTALLMCAVVTQGGRRRQALHRPVLRQHRGRSNAGGAFSPFGDITTLMVWQAGLVQFYEFFSCWCRRWSTT